MTISYSNTWILCMICCLIAFALGYGMKSRIDFQRENQLTSIPHNWGRAARRRWPGLSGWSDAQIDTMLGSPARFRSAFNECGTMDDQEIRSMLSKDPGDKFEFYQPCVQAEPERITFDMSKAKTLSGAPMTDAVPVNWTK